jgi:hypothetical protein
MVTSKPAVRPGLPWLQEEVNRRMTRNAVALFGLLGIATLCCGYEDSPVTTPGRANGGPSAISEGVTGRIADAGGGPIAGALVQPKSLDENARAIPEIAIVSDGEGRYVWRLFAGRYELAVSAAGYNAAAAQVTVNAGQVTIQDFTLERLR